MNFKAKPKKLKIRKLEEKKNEIFTSHQPQSKMRIKWYRQNTYNFIITNMSQRDTNLWLVKIYKNSHSYINYYEITLQSSSTNNNTNKTKYHTCISNSREKKNQIKNNNNKCLRTKKAKKKFILLLVELVFKKFNWLFQWNQIQFFEKFFFVNLLCTYLCCRDKSCESFLKIRKKLKKKMPEIT